VELSWSNRGLSKDRWRRQPGGLRLGGDGDSAEQARLVEDLVHVVLDRAEGDPQALGDLCVRQPLRATGECWLNVKGGDRRYRALEVPPPERAPVIAAYLQRWGNQTRARSSRNCPTRWIIPCSDWSRSNLQRGRG
jgi:hypothetical protein